MTSHDRDQAGEPHGHNAPATPSVAFVAGAHTRLGHYLAQWLGSTGTKVAAIDQNGSPPDRNISVAIAHRNDPQTREAVDRAVTELGAPTLLLTVNDLPPAAAFADLDSAAWSDLLENVVGRSLDACRAVLPVMRQHGGGTIVAVSPAPGPDVEPGPDRGTAHYAAAHHTLLGMMRTLAIEAGPDSINVTTLAPVPIATPATSSHQTDLSADGLTALADTIAYLIGDGSFCTGQVMAPKLTIADR
ncbi:MAG: hypothetical protein DLM58_06160 [Pseudonocardiales bacterium]|nr:MAG: hypothetical protein DLM58_06160 [Pseudonocardiales bacterium]